MVEVMLEVKYIVNILSLERKLEVELKLNLIMIGLEILLVT